MFSKVLRKATTHNLIRNKLLNHKDNEYISFILKTYSEIRSRHWLSVRKKLLTTLFILLNAVWAIPSVLIIRCLCPWRIIRLGSITCDQIGHFVLEVSWLWALRQQQTNKSLDLYWFNSSRSALITWIGPKPCNNFYAELTKRNFLIYPGFWLQPISTWNRIIPGGKIQHIPNSWERKPFTRDVHGWLARTQNKLPFSTAEDSQAKSWLRQQGWQDGDPFVCLLVRDSGYKGETGYEKEYSIRNSDISTYVNAVEWLADQGIWVFRMGKKMIHPIPANHPRIIDYAFHPGKSDFLDIWLFAHCDLCISTSSGIDVVSLSYDRPTLYLNFIPLAWFVSSNNAMHAFKKLVWQTSGTSLSLREYFDNCLHGKSQYDEKGIQIIDLTSEEILMTVQEQWQRLQGTWIDTEADQDRHHQFWEVLNSHPDFNKYHGWIHPQSRAATTWLRSMESSFFA
jgi:putative glycosyltransferase (TIGR04372 family)